MIVQPLMYSSITSLFISIEVLRTPESDCILELTWCSVGGAHQEDVYTVVAMCCTDASCSQQRASRAVRDQRRESMYSNLQQRNSAGFIKSFYFPVRTQLYMYCMCVG